MPVLKNVGLPRAGACYERPEFDTGSRCHKSSLEGIDLFRSGTIGYRSGNYAGYHTAFKLTGVKSGN